MVDRRVDTRVALLALASCVCGSVCGQEREPADQSGVMITIRGTIDSHLKNLVISKSRAAAKQGAQVIIFDLQASHTADFGPCYDLADAITKLGGTVQKTVAYVSQPITGHAVLVAVACDEIVMHETARLGNVYRDDPDGGTRTQREAYEEIARNQGHGEWLGLAMADRKVELLEVKTPNGTRLLPAEQLEEFARNARVLNRDNPTVVKRAGEMFVIDAEQARHFGLARRIVSSRQEVALAYGLPERLASADVLSDEPARPIVLRIEGSVDSRKYGYVLRRLKKIEDGGYNLVFVQVDSIHGDESAAGSIAAAIGGLRERHVKTVAWVPKEAVGPALFIVFACDELVMAAQATIGNFEKPGANADDYRDFAASALERAKGTTFPPALVRGFFDPNVAVFEVRHKKDPRLRSYRTADELQNDDQWEKSRPGPVKPAGELLKMEGPKAVELEVAVGLAEAADALGQLYGVSGTIDVLEPTWIDELVDALTSSGGKFLLITLGVMCLVLELHMPGFGIAGLISVLCFVLFFWAHFLNNMANSLEIVLFLLGLGLLAVEIFVLPGFGVTGVTGAILLVTSLVLASQTSSTPEPGSLLTVAAALVVVVGGILTFGRYLPRMPLLNRFVLAPAEDPVRDAGASNVAGFDDERGAELVGRYGVAVSPLRPAGRMELDGRYYDVVSQGAFIEPGTVVEIVQVSQNRILVREGATV
jgi:membrane-bound serine protease (ClpP class)